MAKRAKSEEAEDDERQMKEQKTHASDNPEPPPSSETGIKCYRCLQRGHKAKECPNEAAPEPEPEFALSGKLAEEANSVNGVPRVYSEPSDTAVPPRGWRLYVFKGDSIADNRRPYVELHKQSAFLLGKDTRVVDIPAEHPSCSRQHAVVQFRAPTAHKVSPKPYIIDLGSTNGTHLNSHTIEAQRYYELLERDIFSLGNSSRDYVILHEKSAEAT